LSGQAHNASCLNSLAKSEFIIGAGFGLWVRRVVVGITQENERFLNVRVQLFDWDEDDHLGWTFALNNSGDHNLPVYNMAVG
jgi:hypothetical protein